MAIPFVKKTFGIGDDFTPQDANDMQDQYEAAILELDAALRNIADGFVKKEFTGDGISKTFTLDFIPEGKPIVFYKLTGETYPHMELTTTTDNPDFFAYWIPGSNQLQIPTDNGAPETNSTLYVYTLMTAPLHAATHATAGTDVLLPSQIGAYTKAETDAIMGITPADALTLAQNVKKDATVPAVIRINPTEVEEMEIYYVYTEV